MKNPTITILRIRPGEPPENVTIPNNLESLQSEVGGTIQAILIVGLSDDDFVLLTPELLAKFANRFSKPEAFVRMDGRIAVIRL